MTTLLHLDSSILGPASVSRTLSMAAVQRLTAADPSVKVVYRDLSADPLPHLSGVYLGAARSNEGQHTAALQHDLAISAAVLDEFLAADIVVIGVAFYNFTVSTQLKAWIDRILVAGKTFRYTERGSEGLVGDKRVILAIARGGFYGPESPSHAFEHGESYLRSVLGFIGIAEPEVLSADGIAVGPEQRETALKGALDQISRLPLAA